MDSSGLFSFKGIKDRSVLKLAPDAFAIMNNAFGEAIIAPMDANSTTFSAPGDRGKSVQLQGGITSLNVNTTISPAGGGRANIEVLAPQYKGMHNDYYVDMPNGIRMPYFIPMTEVKVFMKSRFIEGDPKYKYKPQYYPVFWGFITSVEESYSDGVSTFSLSCADMLNWWSFQKVTIKPSSDQALSGAPQANKFPTIFEYLNPWETIYSLFMDTFFVQGDKENADGLTSNFVAPEFSSSGARYDLGSITETDLRNMLGGLARNTTQYWSNRFGFQAFAGINGKSSSNDKGILEMHGLRGPVNITNWDKDIMRYKMSAEKTKGRTVTAELDLDFSILERIQPYGQFSLYGSGSESVMNTKLEIANKVCDDTHMEFFLDLNGSFVFKPPMYNLDVVSGGDSTYIIKSEDTVNFTFAQNTDGLVNFLEVTGPVNYNTPEINYKGIHIDYPSIRRFGMRHQVLSMNYGNSSESLRAIAVAEMARINSKTKTATISIPLRSEMRMGYPVYLSHIDAYYYVTGITHSFTFGSTATTQLSLESRRDRVFSDGSIADKSGAAVPVGTILRAYVSELRKGKAEIEDADLEVASQGSRTSADIGQDNKASTKNSLMKEYIKDTKGLFSGNNSVGLTKIRPARTTLNPDVAIPSGTPEDGNTDARTSLRTNSNELIHITNWSVPYTDINGYEHIGAFPYGANLRLDRSDSRYNIVDMTDRASSDVYINKVINNISPA